MRALTVICTAVTILTSCASTPKPVMQEDQYRFFANAWVLMYKCGSSDRMSMNAATFGTAHINGWKNVFEYDVPRMSAAVSNSMREPTDQECQQASIVAETWRRDRVQQINTANAATQAQQAALNNQINSNRSSTIYCNTAGTQTVCSKY